MQLFKVKDQSSGFRYRVLPGPVFSEFDRSRYLPAVRVDRFGFDCSVPVWIKEDFLEEISEEPKPESIMPLTIKPNALTMNRLAVYSKYTDLSMFRLCEALLSNSLHDIFEKEREAICIKTGASRADV